MMSNNTSMQQVNSSDQEKHESVNSDSKSMLHGPVQSSMHGISSTKSYYQASGLGSSLVRIKDPSLIKQLKSHKVQMSAIVKNITLLRTEFLEALKQQQEIDARIQEEARAHDGASSPYKRSEELQRESSAAIKKLHRLSLEIQDQKSELSRVKLHKQQLIESVIQIEEEISKSSYTTTVKQMQTQIDNMNNEGSEPSTVRNRSQPITYQNSEDKDSNNPLTTSSKKSKSSRRTTSIKQTTEQIIEDNATRDIIHKQSSSIMSMDSQIKISKSLAKEKLPSEITKPLAQKQQNTMKIKSSLKRLEEAEPSSTSKQTETIRTQIQPGTSKQTSKSGQTGSVVNTSKVARSYVSKMARNVKQTTREEKGQAKSRSTFQKKSVEENTSYEQEFEPTSLKSGQQVSSSEQIDDNYSSVEMSGDKGGSLHEITSLKQIVDSEISVQEQRRDPSGDTSLKITGQEQETISKQAISHHDQTSGTMKNQKTPATKDEYTPLKVKPSMNSITLDEKYSILYNQSLLSNSDINQKQNETEQEKRNIQQQITVPEITKNDSFESDPRREPASQVKVAKLGQNSVVQNSQEDSSYSSQIVRSQISKKSLNLNNSKIISQKSKQTANLTQRYTDIQSHESRISQSVDRDSQPNQDTDQELRSEQTKVVQSSQESIIPIQPQKDKLSDNQARASLHKKSESQQTEEKQNRILKSASIKITQDGENTPDYSSVENDFKEEQDLTQNNNTSLQGVEKYTGGSGSTSNPDYTLPTNSSQKASLRSRQDCQIMTGDMADQQQSGGQASNTDLTDSKEAESPQEIDLEHENIKFESKQSLNQQKQITPANQIQLARTRDMLKETNNELTQMSMTGELQHHHGMFRNDEASDAIKNKRNSTKLDGNQEIQEIQQKREKREYGKENNQLNQLKRQIDELNPNSQRTRTMIVYSNKQSPAHHNHRTTNEIELQLKIESDKLNQKRIEIVQSSDPIQNQHDLLLMKGLKRKYQMAQIQREKINVAAQSLRQVNSEARIKPVKPKVIQLGKTIDATPSVGINMDIVDGDAFDTYDMDMQQAPLEAHHGTNVQTVLREQKKKVKEVYSQSNANTVKLVKNEFISIAPQTRVRDKFDKLTSMIQINESVMQTQRHQKGRKLVPISDTSKDSTRLNNTKSTRSPSGMSSSLPKVFDSRSQSTIAIQPRALDSNLSGKTSHITLQSSRSKQSHDHLTNFASVPYLGHQNLTDRSNHNSLDLPNSNRIPTKPSSHISKHSKQLSSQKGKLVSIEEKRESIKKENPIQVQKNRYNSVLKFQRNNISILQNTNEHQIPLHKHAAIKQIEQKKYMLQKQQRQMRQGWKSSASGGVLPQLLEKDINKKQYISKQHDQIAHYINGFERNTTNTVTYSTARPTPTNQKKQLFEPDQLIAADRIGQYLNDCTLSNDQTLSITKEQVYLDDSLFDSKLFNESVQASCGSRDFPLALLSSICNQLLFFGEGVILKYQENEVIQDEYEKIKETFIILNGKVGLSIAQDQSEASIVEELTPGDTFFEEAVEYAHHLYSYDSGATSPQPIRYSPSAQRSNQPAFSGLKLISEEKAQALCNDTYVMKLSSKSWLSLKRKLEINNQNIDVFSLKNLLKKNLQKKKNKKNEQVTGGKQQPDIELAVV